MTDPIPSHPPTPASGLPSEVPLAGIKVNPGDEKLLTTPFGKMFKNMPGASDQDQTTLIKEIKAAINQYCMEILRQMKIEDARYKEAMARLKRVAQGQSPD